MLEAIKTNLLLPLVGRLGTAGATVLVGYGIDGTAAEQIMTGVIAAALVTYDLAVSYLSRKRSR